MAIEATQQFLPIFVSFGHLVKVLLHFRRKVIIHNLGKRVQEKVVDDEAHIRRKQLILLRAVSLRFSRIRQFFAAQSEHIIFTLASRPILLYHIFALLYGGDGRRIGRRATDAQFFKFMHQRRLIIAGRMLRKALCGRYFYALQRSPFLYWGQQAALCVLFILMAAFAIYF